MKLSKKVITIVGITMPMLLAGCGNKGCVHTYDYSNPTWNWAEDYSSASVSFNCTSCGEAPKTYNATINIDDKDPSCAEVTCDIYTATVTVEGNTYTDVKSVANPLADHTYDYSNPIWYWAEDYSEANVAFKCSVCEQESSPVSAQITNDIHSPSCTEGGTSTYTASATVDGKTISDTKTVIGEPTGHQFSSLKVSGTYLTEYTALETFNKAGMEVLKFCELDNHEEPVSSSDIVIQYQNGDRLHVGDTKVTIKVGSLTSDVSVVVNAIKVAKPNEDSTTFTYDGVEKTYVVAPSNDYTVTGNKATDAGTHQVTISLNDKRDHTWSDGSTDDLVYNFVIEKGNVAITGLKTSYTSTCKTMPDFSDVTSTIGVPTITVYSDEACLNAVTVDELTAGTYYVKAVVEGNTNFNGAEAKSTLVVSHSLGEVEMDLSRIGTKARRCGCGAKEDETPVTTADIDFSVNTFGDLINWHPTGSWLGGSYEPSTITNEPTWADWGHRATTTKTSIVYSQVQQWCGSRKLELPKIDYSVFTKVSFDMNVDIEPGSIWKTFACSFDTIDNRDGSFTQITNMASKTGVLSVTHLENVYTMNIKYGEVNESMIITDEDIINGNKPLCFYSFMLGGSATPNITLDNLKLINETEHTFTEHISSHAIGQVEKSCVNCGFGEYATSDDFVANFVENKYGAAIALETEGWSDKLKTCRVDNNSNNSITYNTEVNYDGVSHKELTFGLELPRMDLRGRGLVTFPLRAEDNNMKLSLGGLQTAKLNSTGLNGALAFSNITDSTMTVTVEIGGSSVTKNYTNVADVISGEETFKDLKMVATAQFGRRLTLLAPTAKAPFGLGITMTSGHAFENCVYDDSFKYGLLYISINNSSWADMTARLDFYRLNYRECGKVVYDVGAKNKDSGAIENNSDGVNLKLNDSTTWNVGNSTQVKSYISFEMVSEGLKVTCWNEANEGSEVSNLKSVIVTDENVISGLVSYSTTMTFGNNWRHFTINSISFVD